MANRINGFEHYARANFLYQAAVRVFQVDPGLSKLYINEMRQLCEKVVIRMDPDIKRNFCKKCSYLLVFLERCVETKGKVSYLLIKCPDCGYLKRTKVQFAID